MWISQLNTPDSQFSWCSRFSNLRPQTLDLQHHTSVSTESGLSLYWVLLGSQLPEQSRGEMLRSWPRAGVWAHTGPRKEDGSVVFFLPVSIVKWGQNKAPVGKKRGEGLQWTEGKEGEERRRTSGRCQQSWVTMVKECRRKWRKGGSGWRAGIGLE